jgi:5,10-methylenetetrahydromethanopterin reductase
VQVPGACAMLPGLREGAMRGIRIGIGVGVGQGGLAAALAEIARAETAGFHSVWIANIFGVDAMTLASLSGTTSSRIELGTAVVPTHSRHPVYMAQQALTTQAACGGRFVLGLGPSHKMVIEGMLGLSFAKPAQHVREYVQIVSELARTGRSAFQGRTYRVNASLSVPEASAKLPILIGGLGPLMRRIAGSLCDGTITWMTGPRAIGEQLAPDLARAASEAGRPAPRIVCGLPVCLTQDVAGAREAAARAFAVYGQLPSYRAMLDAEHAAGPGDLLLAGDAGQIERAIEGLRSAGATDLNAAVFGHGPDREASVERTFQLLAELSRRG